MQVKLKLDNTDYASSLVTGVVVIYPSYLGDMPHVFVRKVQISEHKYIQQVYVQEGCRLLFCIESECLLFLDSVTG